MRLGIGWRPYTRFNRYQDAVHWFRRHFPDVTGPSLCRLVDLAVDYWERPERFA